MASPRGQKEANRALTLGTFVRKRRREQKLTLAALGKRIPMSASNLSRLELGSQGAPSDEVIERIAKALDSEPAELLQAAGRTAGGQPFEEVVLGKLEEIQRDMREVKAAVQSRKK
jgi:transcriptional regulator with XRE-family HTH domain